MITNQRMLFPEPATIIRSDQDLGGCEGTEGRTFPVDPQQGCGRLGLPFHEGSFLKEPHRCPLMLGAAREILISGWVRWGQPPSVVPPYPAPCVSLEPQQPRAAGLKDHERLAVSILFAVCCTRAFVSLPSRCIWVYDGVCE